MEPQPNSQQSDPRHVEMPDYLLVFRDPQAPPPCEHSFQAMDDQHAFDLMKQEYPTFKWELYQTNGSDRQLVRSFPEVPNA